MAYSQSTEYTSYNATGKATTWSFIQWPSAFRSIFTLPPRIFKSPLTYSITIQLTIPTVSDESYSLAEFVPFSPFSAYSCQSRYPTTPTWRQYLSLFPALRSAGYAACGCCQRRQKFHCSTTSRSPCSSFCTFLLLPCSLRGDSFCCLEFKTRR